MNRLAKHSTHVTTLTRAFDLSEGDVVEIGTGHFSTTLLHWLGAITGRRITSYETDVKWFQRAKRYQCEYHDIILVENWDDIPLESQHWGLAFIDHSPHARRSIETKRLKDIADFIVIHDTEPRSEKLYGYPDIYSLFTYRYDSKKVEPWTTVLSNKFSLEKFES